MSRPSTGFTVARNIVKQARQKNWRSLELNNLNLIDLPPEVLELNNVRNVSAWGNKFEKFPEVILSMHNLEYLNLAENCIKEIPKEICNLFALKGLDLTDNLIENIPVELCYLSRLEKLYLFRNKIMKLPNEIGNLERLEELYLLGNQISDLPITIRGLQRLKKLNLSKNKLRNLPREITFLQNLEELFLHENPELRLPRGALGPTSSVTFHKTEENSIVKTKKKPIPPSSIFNYYFTDRPEPLLEARLIIVGDGGVGKTSLVKQLIRSERAVEGEKSTDSVAIEPWNIKMRDSNVKINIWDFAGQEPMHAAHPYFFTERTLYIIVASAREDQCEDRIRYWLKMVERYGNGACALVVVNKIDQHAMDVDRKGLIHECSILPRDPTQAFFPTSCTSGDGIESLIRAICREFERFDQIWDLIPLEYLNVKKRIAEMQARKENIISFEKWENICHENGVSVQDQRRQLLELLRDLGLVISFPDNIKLNYLGVLNPNWVVDAIYPVISCKKLSNTRGLLDISDFSEILPEGPYPKAVHGWLIDLMKLFELLFSNEANQLFVPVRLTKEAPNWALDPRWRDSDALQLEFRYDVLPESVISRFIVRKHSKAAYSGCWWRHGIVLKEQECEALVHAHPNKGIIEVCIIGPKLKRQIFLHGLRAELRNLTDYLGPERLWLVLGEGYYQNFDELIIFAQAGLKHIPRAVGNKVIQLDVRAVLDQIDPQLNHPQEVFENTGPTIGRPPNVGMKPSNPDVPASFPKLQVDVDLILRIERIGLGEVRFDARARDGRQVGPFNKQIREAAEFASRLTEIQLKSRRDEAGARDESLAFAELLGLGKDIADVIPKGMVAGDKALLTQSLKKRTPPSILILTDEAFVPWELALLTTAAEDKRFFLGEVAEVGRWPLDAAREVPPAELTIGQMHVFAAESYSGAGVLKDLPEALEERHYLKKTYGAISHDGTGPEIDAWLRSTQAGEEAVHMALHGYSDPSADVQHLILGDGSKLTPHSFLGLDAERRIARKYSLVFLNACQTGAAGQTLGLVGGFPGVLARSGAGAVIAPLWEVGDRNAREFAEQFYQMTFSNQMRVGIALRNLRSGKRRNESIDRFAYIFYGHPLLTFKLE